MKNIMKWIAAAVVAVSVSVSAGEFSGGGYVPTGGGVISAEAQVLIDALSDVGSPEAVSMSEQLKATMVALAQGGGSFPVAAHPPVDSCEYPVFNPENKRVLITKVRVFVPNAYFSGGSVIDGEVEDVAVVLEWNDDAGVFEVIPTE